MRFLPLTALVVACPPPTAQNESGDSGPPEFCESLSDEGVFQTEAVGGTAGSGDLVVRVITAEDVDVRNPLYISFKDYTLENIDTGGIQQTGQTSGDGIAALNGLGAGTWYFRASFLRGSTVCLAEIEVEIQVAATTTGCAVMRC